MSLHADVAAPQNDRRRLERLCRYLARPSLALDRLEAMADGRLAYRLKTRWRDGTTHVLMERHGLLERLAPYSEAVASSSPLRARKCIVLSVQPDTVLGSRPVASPTCT